MSGLEEENKKLDKKNQNFQNNDTKNIAALKLVAFVVIIILTGYVQTTSIELAMLLGAAGFYFCFMR